MVNTVGEERKILVWFRQDLRVHDHPALAKAAKVGSAVIPLYIFDETSAGQWVAGGASRWWLHYSLTALAKDLENLGSPLLIARGNSRVVLAEIACKLGVSSVFTSRMYEPWAVTLEKDLYDILQREGIALHRFSGTLLKEPEELATQSGTPFKVYTPFWRALSSSQQHRTPVAKPKRLVPASDKLKIDTLDDLQLLPTKPNWSHGLQEVWRPGEASARKQLKDFLSANITGYHDQRNRPDKMATSRLSPHLHFGEISPATVWKATNAARDAGCQDGDYETFLKELVWREFSAHLLFHFQDLPTAPFRPEYGKFPWRTDNQSLSAWQHGQTGYPIVDAGMRELWATGWMHNRVRMIAASFLIKDLFLPWQEGEKWFWDTLVDADLASNAASWQWVAGSGADAAPFFRIFNPVTQGRKFDPDGAYVRKWVPELANLPDKFIHAPWTAPDDVLTAANIELDINYPNPIVDHSIARQTALEGYKKVKA
ncbi:MAG: cryptochrome/photolyase family protein [Hyphomicrobiaceae bacterium]